MTQFEDASLEPLQSLSIPSIKSDHQKMLLEQDGEKSRNDEEDMPGYSNKTDKDETYRCMRPWSWSILPVALGLTSAAGFVATYFFAKSNCHIQKWILPYLSYTGTEYPESMIFGLILNTEGFLGLIVVFLAWRYYQHMGQSGRLNHVTLLFGGFSCFGVIMVGNFQVTKAKVPHYIGAGLAFIIGTGYGTLTSIISRRTFKAAKACRKYANYVAVVHIRIGIAAVMIASLICLTGVGLSKKLNHRNKSQEAVRNVTHELTNGLCPESVSNKSANALNIDLIGAITEWLLTACLLLCLSLFAYEFQMFRSVKVVLQTHNGPLRANNIRHNSLGTTKNSSYSRPTGTSASSYSQDRGSWGKSSGFFCNNKRDQHDFVESQYNSGENKSKSPNTSLHSLTQPCLVNTITDSGIGDGVPFLNNRLSNLSRTVRYSSSLPNIIAVETV